MKNIKIQSLQSSYKLNFFYPLMKPINDLQKCKHTPSDTIFSGQHTYLR